LENFYSGSYEVLFGWLLLAMSLLYVIKKKPLFSSVLEVFDMPWDHSRS